MWLMPVPFPLGGGRAGEARCCFHCEPENHWITAQSNSIVSPTPIGGWNINKATKEQKTDRPRQGKWIYSKERFEGKPERHFQWQATAH